MTIPVQQPWVDYDYTGPGEYEFQFYIDEATSLRVRHVIENESIVDLIYGQDYTAEFTPYGPGKIITTYDPPAYGTLRIERNTPKEHKVDYVNNDPFDMEILEKDFDRVTMIIQELKRTFEMTGLTTWRGEWKPNTVYQAHDAVTGPKGSVYEYSIFTAVVDHTSSDDFETDFLAGIWHLSFDMVDLAELVARAEQAAQDACDCQDEACQCKIAACECATNAQKSEDNAQQHAIDAAEYVSLAGERAQCASYWANYPEDQPVPCGDGTQYSAYHWAVKSAHGGLNELYSTDTEMILIESYADKERTLVIHSDRALGIPKLDANGKIKVEQIPLTGMTFFGGLRGDDDCPKSSPYNETPCAEPDYRNPTERFDDPSLVFVSGSYFIITSDGNMNLKNPDDPGGPNTVQAVASGDGIIYADGSGAYPEGWYLIPGVVQGGDIASNILFDDSNTNIKGTNVQVWNEAADAAIQQKMDKGGGEFYGDIIINKDDPALEFNDAGNQRWRFHAHSDNTFVLQNFQGGSWENIVRWMDQSSISHFSEVIYIEGPLPENRFYNTAMTGGSKGQQWREFTDTAGNYHLSTGMVRVIRTCFTRITQPEKFISLMR